MKKMILYAGIVLFSLGFSGLLAQNVVIDFEDVPAGTYAGTGSGPLLLDGFAFHWIGYGNYQKVVDWSGNNVLTDALPANVSGAEDLILTDDGRLFYFHSLEYGNRLSGVSSIFRIDVRAYGEGSVLLKFMQLQPTTSGLTLTAADLDVEGVPLFQLQINLVSYTPGGIDYYYDNIDVTPQPIPVMVDIKPGCDMNCINNDWNGVIPVAILGSADFDVSQIDPATVLLEGLSIKAVGKDGKLLAHIEDVNGDGYDDLMVQFQDQEGAFVPGSTTAIVTGNLKPAFGGKTIEGTDAICLVPIGLSKPFLNAKAGNAPNDFVLYQNHPNPFNPATHIRFSLPSACHISLNVYDMSGRLVTSLAKQYYEAGFHQLEWNAKDQPSGVYVIHFRAGTYTQMMKMMLVK